MLLRVPRVEETILYSIFSVCKVLQTISFYTGVGLSQRQGMSLYTGVGSGGQGGHVPPPHFWEGGGKICLCPPPLSDPEFRPRHRAYWYLWRHFGVACITVLGPSDVPPPHILSRSYAVAIVTLSIKKCLGPTKARRIPGLDICLWHPPCCP